MDNPEKELQNKVEAVLFAAGRKISLDEIARICKDDPKKTKEAIEAVKQKLKDTDSPLLVVEESDGYKMIVRELYLSHVKQIVPATDLGRSILETLAIIAWKKPINQSEVVKIRSSKAYDHIAELEDLGFVHKEKKGRSFIIKTTQKFADYFDLPTKEGIKKIMQPAVDAIQERYSKEDALKEKVEGMEIYYGKEQKPNINGMEVFEEERQQQEKNNDEKPEEEAQEENWAQESGEEQAKEPEKTYKKPAEEEEGTEEEPEEKADEEETEEEGKFSLKKIKEDARKEFEEETRARKPKPELENEEKKDEIKIEEKGRKVDERLEKMIEISKKGFDKLKGKEVEEEYAPEEEEEEPETISKKEKKNSR